MEIIKFIEILNDIFKDDKLQIIPAETNEKMPKLPFVTYEVLETDSDVAVGERELDTSEDIIENIHFRKITTLNFRIYSSAPDELISDYNRFYEVLILNDEEILHKGFAMLNFKLLNTLTEEVDKRKIHSYIIKLKVQYNSIRKKSIKELKQVEYLEQKIDWR